MKKLVYTLSLLGALAVGANADEIEHHTPLLVGDGCYEIGTAAELFGFADIVNGIRNAENPEEYSQAPQPGVCGKLVADIRVVAVDSPSGKGNHVVSDDLKTANVPEENHWTPMVNFSGTFDGQGHSISGIFFGTSKEEIYAAEAGFIINLQDGAVIKNLRILDSYFAANTSAGSLAANVSGSVSIKGFEFSGIIDKAGKAGGVFGNIVSNAKLALHNIIAEGAVTSTNEQTTGGIIGSSDAGSAITFYSCYSKILVGGSFQRGVIGRIVTAKDPENSSKDLFTLINNSSIFCAGTGDKCNLQKLCTDGASSENKNDVSVCKERFSQSLNDSLQTNKYYKAHGVNFEYNADKQIIIAHITEWMKDDNGEYIEENGERVVLDSLYIPAEVYVDSVDFDRVFSDKSSTITLPFNIAASKITASATCEDYEPLKFNTFDNASITLGDEKKYEIEVTTEIQEITAHTPYLVKGINGNIHFCGPVTLQKTRSSSGKTISLNKEWKIVGTYRTMLTTSADTGSYENTANLGKIYGFVGTADVPYIGESTFQIGQFAKAGHNVRTREMRAYLIYSGNQIAPNAAPPYRNMNRAAPATTVLDLSDEDLPNTIDVIVDEKEIVVPKKVTVLDSTLIPTRVLATITFEYPSDEDDNEENSEESTTAIAKPFISPLKSNKLDSWRDIKGRSLNGKPNIPGTYFKNGIPVIIK